MHFDAIQALEDILCTELIEQNYNVQRYTNGTYTLKPKHLVKETLNELPTIDENEERWGGLKMQLTSDELTEVSGYFISNYGRFKRPTRPEPHFSDALNHNGTPVINIRGRSCTVISLVAANFLKKPEYAGRVAYIDRSNPMNTHVSNIRYVTNGVITMNAEVLKKVEEANSENDYEDEEWKKGPYMEDLFYVPDNLWISNYGRIKHSSMGEPKIVRKLDSSGAPYLCIDGRNIRLIRMIAALHIQKRYPECYKVRYKDPMNKTNVHVSNIEWIVTPAMELKYLKAERGGKTRRHKPDTSGVTRFVPYEGQEQKPGITPNGNLVMKKSIFKPATERDAKLMREALEEINPGSREAEEQANNDPDSGDE